MNSGETFVRMLIWTRMLCDRRKLGASIKNPKHVYRYTSSVVPIKKPNKKQCAHRKTLYLVDGRKNKKKQHLQCAYFVLYALLYLRLLCSSRSAYYIRTIGTYTFYKRATVATDDEMLIVFRLILRLGQPWIITDD